jgi:hypothetical protein
VINGFLADRIEDLQKALLDAETQHTSVVAELQKGQAIVTNDLKLVKDELEKYRRLRFAEPPAKIPVTAAPPEPVDPAEKRRIRGWLGVDER